MVDGGGWMDGRGGGVVQFSVEELGKVMAKFVVHSVHFASPKGVHIYISQQNSKAHKEGTTRNVPITYCQKNIHIVNTDGENNKNEMFAKHTHTKKTGR